jgi:hypothetical protein
MGDSDDRLEFTVMKEEGYEIKQLRVIVLARG